MKVERIEEEMKAKTAKIKQLEEALKNNESLQLRIDEELKRKKGSSPKKKNKEAASPNAGSHHYYYMFFYYSSRGKNTGHS